jgi:hypothetical protein
VLWTHYVRQIVRILLIRTMRVSDDYAVLLIGLGDGFHNYIHSAFAISFLNLCKSNLSKGHFWVMCEREATHLRGNQLKRGQIKFACNLIALVSTTNLLTWFPSITSLRGSAKGLSVGIKGWRRQEDSQSISASAMKVLLRTDTHVDLNVPCEGPKPKCTFSQVDRFEILFSQRATGFFFKSMTSLNLARFNKKNMNSNKGFLTGK